MVEVIGRENDGARVPSVWARGENPGVDNLDQAGFTFVFVRGLPFRHPHQ
jgi:hypothetical protein